MLTNEQDDPTLTIRQLIRLLGTSITSLELAVHEHAARDEQVYTEINRRLRHLEDLDLVGLTRRNFAVGLAVASGLAISAIASGMALIRWWQV